MVSASSRPSRCAGISWTLSGRAYEWPGSRMVSAMSIRSPGTSCGPSNATATQEDNPPWVFPSERQAQLTARPSTTSCACARYEGEARAGLAPHAVTHPRLHLATQGTDLRTMQDYLGHRDRDPRHYTPRCRPPVRG